MSEEEKQLLVIRGVFVSLNADEQVKVKQAEAELRAVLLKHGEHGRFALALIGAEWAAEK